jgi:hypothetical protein
MPIDRKGGKRAVGPQYAFDCAFGGLQFVHRTLTKGRGESGGKQQRIAISKRNIQIFSKADDHLSARLGLTGLETREVPCRTFRGDCEICLCHPPLISPAAQENPEWNLIYIHPAKVDRDLVRFHDL